MTDTTTNQTDRSELRDEIMHALNRASAENMSGTPDHVLAHLLTEVLDVFEHAVMVRAAWRGETTDLRTPKAEPVTTDPNPQDHAYYVSMTYGDAQVEIRRDKGTVTITPRDGGKPMVFDRQAFGAIALMFDREGDTTRPSADGDDLEAGDEG